MATEDQIAISMSRSEAMRTAAKVVLTNKILLGIDKTLLFCDGAILKTAKEIGEGLFMSSRSVSGAMRKLITCGYVVRQNANPVMYALTDLGKSYNS